MKNFKFRQKNQRKTKNRESEKGSAMVMTLMVSFLLLIASAGLLLESSMNTANVTDATAEQQAYNAAESGIQTAINILRGNVAPSPLFDTSKSASDPSNRIDFVKALKLSSSNLSNDSSAEPRLSRWMEYNYKPSGSLDDDARVVLGDASTYEPLKGYAYKISIDDPDNTGSLISYTTSSSDSGIWNASASSYTSSVTYGNGGNTVTIAYNPVTVNNLNVASGSANTNLGNFSISTEGSGANISTRTRFVISLDMTVPYTETKEIRGWIETGSISNNSVGNVKLLFDSQAFDLMGSIITINPSGASSVFVSPSSSNNFRTGYEVKPYAPNTNGGVTVVNASMTPAEPSRLLVRATGYGPRGAQKQLEAIIQKNFLNGLGAPATLTLIGSNTGFYFNDGSSQNVTYSGDDIVTNMVIPPVGATNSQNLAGVVSKFDGKTDVIGTPSNVSGELPFWLKSTYNLHETVLKLKNVAEASGRVFPNNQYSSPPNFGDNATAKGITFVNGDVSLSGAGGGILVCTGKLTLNGQVNFKGLIIVTGAGGIDRKGGGNGLLQGNTVVAPYNPGNLGAGFLGPKYDISGGGTSEMRYNSSSVANGLTAVSNFVLGVAEK